MLDPSLRSVLGSDEFAIELVLFILYLPPKSTEVYRSLHSTAKFSSASLLIHIYYSSITRFFASVF